LLAFGIQTGKYPPCVLERLQGGSNGQEWHITIALLIGAVESAEIMQERLVKKKIK